MPGCRFKLTFVYLFAAFLFSCSASGGSEEGAKNPEDYEIADVRNLPQDIGAYASSFHDGCLGKKRRDYYLSEFRRKYYAPWTGGASITDVKAFVETMKEYLQKEWYGENRRKVPRNVMEELSANCYLEHLPTLKRPAVVTTATNLRVLPSDKPFFENADDFPFDALQNTGLKLNEPIRVLHLSRDRLWAFIETADTNGWVDVRDVGFMDMKTAGKWKEKAQIVIVRDETQIRDKDGSVNKRVNVGAICPLVAEKDNSYEISVPVNTGLLNVKIVKAKVPKEMARRFPLKPDSKFIALIGNELIGKPYGWGEKFRDRDCSAMIRDFYLPFGIWLPRGSYNQINYGNKISLAGLSNSEKERLIKEKGVPFFTLVYRKGHIMLYVGERNDKALIFHNIWGVNVRDGKGGEFKQIIGKSIVSTLNPGGELNLAPGTLLDRLSDMLVMGDRSACASE
jgi:hypothetical protein